MLVIAPLMAWQVAAKAARDGLFLANFGVGALPAVTAATAVLSIIFAIFSTRMVVRFGPARYLPGLLLAGAVLHAIQAYLGSSFPLAMAVLIYLQVSAMGSVLISGFWSVAAERFDAREAKRSFGQIAAAGTLASLAGGLLAERVAHYWGTGPQLLALLAGFQLACAAALARFAAASGGNAAGSDEPAPLPEVISGAPYLIRFAGLIFLLAVTAAFLDFSFKSQAVAHWGRGGELSRFFALYYAGIAVVTFLLQAGVSHLWLCRFGPGRTVASLPITVTGATAAALFLPGVLTATLARAVEQILRGSLFRAGYEQLYAPMPQAERRSAKFLIDIGAERTGDGLAAAALQLLLSLPAAIGGSVILGLGALCSAVATAFALRMDRSYIEMLEKGLANQAITLRPEEAEDYLTRTVLLRTQLSNRGGGADGVATQSRDATLHKLAELRSHDAARVRRALWEPGELEPLVAVQVISLLDNENVARDAAALLRRNLARQVPLLAAALHDTTTPTAVRQRVARILGAAGPASRLASDALFYQLGDRSFNVRYRCALALQAIAANHPEFKPPPEAIYRIVTAELPAAAALWRTGRRTAGAHDRLARTNNYLVALLGLVLPAEPIRLAFRALQTSDPKLRGIALEYLEGVLPKPLASEFAIHLEHADRPRHASTSEALDQLLLSSPAIAGGLEAPGQLEDAADSD